MPAIILIVEDHDAMRMSLRNWLNTIFPQSHVTEATSGEEALAKIHHSLPNVVLMDFKLPGMNGIEATRQIKAALPSAQIVLFSIREGDAYIASAISAGAYAYVPKRAYHTELLPILTTLLLRAQD